jgi:hypothetical protein
MEIDIFQRCSSQNPLVGGVFDASKRILRRKASEI